MQRWGGGIFRERTGEDQTVLGSNTQHGSRGPISSPTPASSFLPCPTSAEGHPLSRHALLCLAATNFFLLFKHPSFSHRWGFSHTVPSVCHSLPVSTLINFSSFRMGCQVTSFRKPSILTPKRSEHQHWQQGGGVLNPFTWSWHKSSIFSSANTAISSSFSCSPGFSLLEELVV